MTKRKFLTIVKKSREAPTSYFLKQEVRRLYAMYSSVQIASMLDMERGDVTSILRGLGLHTKARYDSKVRLCNEPRSRIALVNSPSEDYGKSNPFIAAENHPDLRQHFENNHGVKYYKGKKLATYAEWTPVMRDYNTIMRKHGGKVFDYVQSWVE